jgi:hypothetical protein
LPGARAAAATAAAAPALPRCSLTDATLPFPAREGGSRRHEEPPIEGAM